MDIPTKAFLTMLFKITTLEDPWVTMTAAHWKLPPKHS